MFCSKCGAQCADSMAFCQKCGNPLTQTAVSPQQPAPQPMQPEQMPQQPYAQPQQPMQQPYGMPQQPMYYGAPTKQPMSKGVLAALISSGVVIVALVVVLLIVLLGGDKGGSNNNRQDDDDPSITETTKKTSKTEKTQKTQKTEPDAPARSNDYEDVAEALIDFFENGDVDALFNNLPQEAIDYIVEDNGYSNAREWRADIEEELEAVAEEAHIACEIIHYWDAESDMRAEYVEFYDDVLGLDIDEVIVVQIEERMESYSGEYETEYYTDEFYLVEIDGIWYIEGIEWFS